MKFLNLLSIIRIDLGLSPDFYISIPDIKRMRKSLSLSSPEEMCEEKRDVENMINRYILSMSKATSGNREALNEAISPFGTGGGTLIVFLSLYHLS